MEKPAIVVCDYEKDVADRLMDALRDAHGHQVEVFVLNHDQTGEAVMVLLPEQGPSLAAALRDWVAEWWSDMDEDAFGTPERYIRGLGVAIEPGDDTTFSTSCPYCGVGDHLMVVGGTFQAMGMAIQADGFAFADAKNVTTEDEQIYCDGCHRTFSAHAIRL
ncbi:hypothetical protein [Sulfobacillus harzensis]|uniref:Uncharacterized protein n=1 Tax=Sulfobacillus harzensis TaxID=2729629 RepID=A0A7Y0L7Z8_9FIRM|nr:hypothetical protein [Sulfobacillus harzensis]NMP24688.1 hypothetical protein [Sulfobacillus harzensis]